MKIYTGNTDLYLQDTQVENLFISEYMVTADANAVKVYLLAKMYLDKNREISNKMLARSLRIPFDKVLAAWTYWEANGVIRKHYTGADSSEFDVEFLCLKQQMYGTASGGDSKDADKARQTAQKLNAAIYSDEVLALYEAVEKRCGRPLSSKETMDIKTWLENWQLSAKVIIKAYDICINERKRKPEHSYISAIVTEWYEKGLFTIDSLDEYLAEHDRRHGSYKRIFKALGFIGRYPSEEEQRIMNIWFDEYGLDMSTVLEACGKTSGIASPSINYVNTILKDWKEGGKVTDSGKKQMTNAQISKIYKEIREDNDKISKSRRDEIYSSIPRIREIDDELRDLNPKRLRLRMAGQDAASDYKAMDTEIRNLHKEKDHLLERAGYPVDYLKKVYTCQICKDTGFLDNGAKCICLTNRLKNQ